MNADRIRDAGFEEVASVFEAIKNLAGQGTMMADIKAKGEGIGRSSKTAYADGFEMGLHFALTAIADEMENTYGVEVE